MNCNANANFSVPNKPSYTAKNTISWKNFLKSLYKNLSDQKLGLFGTLKLALALQFIVMNAYFSVARMLTLVLHATLK